MATYEDVHAGDVVLGHDGELWGVEYIARAPQLAVTLVKHGSRVTGFPPAGTPITIVERSDVSAEATAAGMLIAAALGPVSIVAEVWGG